MVPKKVHFLISYIKSIQQFRPLEIKLYRRLSRRSIYGPHNKIGSIRLGKTKIYRFISVMIDFGGQGRLSSIIYITFHIESNPTTTTTRSIIENEIVSWDINRKCSVIV